MIKKGGERYMENSTQEVFYKHGYYWHKPCAMLNYFSRRGRMIPGTIMSDTKKVTYTCEVCGTTWVCNKKR